VTTTRKGIFAVYRFKATAAAEGTGWTAEELLLETKILKKKSVLCNETGRRKRKACGVQTLDIDLEKNSLNNTTITGTLTRKGRLIAKRKKSSEGKKTGSAKTNEKLFRKKPPFYPRPSTSSQRTKNEKKKDLKGNTINWGRRMEKNASTGCGLNKIKYDLSAIGRKKCQ